MRCVHALALSFALFAAASAAPLAASPAGLASASDRPSECRPANEGRRARVTVWQRARLPQRQAYCDRIARAELALASDAARARSLADEAEALWPGRASTEVMRARALVASGDAEEARLGFERALALDPSALDAPRAAADHAHALVRVGRSRDAARAYRELVPLAGRLSRDERSLLLLRAAHASMAAADEAAPSAAASTAPPSAPGSTAPPSAPTTAPITGAVAARPSRESALAAAIAYLEEGRRDPASPWAADLGLTLALALGRIGELARADAAVADARVMGASSTRAVRYVAASADARALEALAASEPGVAREAWEAYLREAPGSIYADHARASLARLGAHSPRPATKPAAKPRAAPPARGSR